ncbi:MAG: hypothetical protein DIU69_05185, partial [Bacillota bacterium]
MLVHRKIVFLVSVVLFAFIAFVAVILTDLHDRFFPVQLGAKASVSLDFSQAGMPDEEAFRQLGLLSDRLGLGLVKLAPDLGSDRSGQVFVVLGTKTSLPDTIQRFGNQPDGKIRDRDALASSFATGTYFVTGETARLAEFKAWLAEHQVDQRWSEDTLGTILEWLVRQSEFGASLLAGTALMVSLVLYWLTVKARGRAIRVLAGVSTWRIQYEDLGGFLMILLAAAVLCDVLAVPYVGVVYGWVFVPYYVKVLLVFEAVVILVTTAFALALAVASWPSPAMLAAREPAVKTLRNSTVVLRVVTFALVLAAVAPAFTAYAQAREAAAEQALWKALADQVVLSFPAGTRESDLQRLMPDVGQVVQVAEQQGSVALSYAFTREHLRLNGYEIAPYRYLVLINRRWLDLMLSDGHDGGSQGRGPVAGLVPLSLDQVPEGARAFLDGNMPLWLRKPMDKEPLGTQLSFYRYAGTRKLPFARIGGELVFPKANEALIVLVPSVHELFNDDFLVSVASTRNLLFTGLEATQRLLSQQGLADSIHVKYSAEEGILRAQIAGYIAWLRAASLVALAVALAVSTGIGAFITAVLKARRDFVLRLAGKSWWTILRPRVVREGLFGAPLAAPVVGGPTARSSVLAAAA